MRRFFYVSLFVASLSTHANEITFSLQRELTTSFPEAVVEGSIGKVWDDIQTIDTIQGPVGLQTGFRIAPESTGLVGLDVLARRSDISAEGYLHFEVDFDLPEDGVVAPEERFTISTNWRTPYIDSPLGTAWFSTTDPEEAEVDLSFRAELDYAINLTACAGACTSARLALPGVNLVDPWVQFNGDLINFLVDGLEDAITIPGGGTQTPSDFATTFNFLLTDPLYVDILALVDGNLTGSSSIGIGTDYTDVDSIFTTTQGPISRGASLGQAWRENAFELNLDITNMIMTLARYQTGFPVPPLNGTAEDWLNIFTARQEQLTPGQRVGGFLLGKLFSQFRYNLLEFELAGQVDVLNQIRLTPQAPEIRIMNGTEALSPWVKAGQDITIAMPLDPSMVTAQVRTAPVMVSDLKIIADPRLSFSAFEISLGPDKSPPPPLVDTGDLVNDGNVTIASTVQRQELESQTSERNLTLPTALATPRQGLSGGGGISFGGSAGECWEPDNLPPDVPSGISFDEDNGCIISFRDFTVGGTVTLNSFSNVPYTFTLLNSTFGGQQGQLASVNLDPNGDTSVQLTGAVRQSGFESVDLFFDDATSSGNQNRIVVNTVHGSFIRNSLLRGLISNENQSDIIVEQGRLWVENSQMELDNITIESGMVTVQDTTASLRNLQVGGTPETSGLRMTRDSLITTASNFSFNSSNVDVAGGSLLNVSGFFQNTGNLTIEPAGWGAVLFGDIPGRTDLLGSSTIGNLNILGEGDRAVVGEALAILPESLDNPSTLFADHVQGTRLTSGVLLISGGIVENHQINLVGGIMLALEGQITDSAIELSDRASIVFDRSSTTISNLEITGAGYIDVLPDATLTIEDITIGGSEPPESGRVVLHNTGVIIPTPSSTLEFPGNATLLQDGQLTVDSSSALSVEDFRKIGGTTRINGVVTPGGDGMAVSGGELSGEGIVNGSVVNGKGTLLADGLEITGNYDQLDAGTTLIDFTRVASPSLVFLGTADLAGSLKIVLTSQQYDNTQPGDEFFFLSYGAVNGGFTRLQLEVEGRQDEELELGFEVVYGASSASVRWLVSEEINVVLPPEELGDDTDQDGMSDGFEMLYGFNFVLSDENDNGIVDGEEDADADGLTNAEESTIGTDPRNTDTDGDGTSDADEVAQGTDPLDCLECKSSILLKLIRILNEQP